MTKGAEVDCQSSVSVDVAVIENCERTDSDIRDTHGLWEEFPEAGRKEEVLFRKGALVALE